MQAIPPRKNGLKKLKSHIGDLLISQSLNYS